MNASSFATGLLARFSQNTAAAKAAERRKAQQAAEERRKAAEAVCQAEKQRLAAEADRVLRKSKSTSQKRVTRRHNNGQKRSTRAPPVAPRPRPVPPSNPLKPLPGMEFVVRKTKKKEVEVPHTSDYSDLYGDEYLVGINLKCTSAMQKESARATKEAKKIHKERKEQVERLRKEADEKIMMEKELAKKGIKPKRRASSDKDWVAVDTPIKLAKGQQLPESILRKAEANSSTSGKRVLSKAAKAVEEKANIKERSRVLKERVLRVTGGDVKKASSPDERSPRRRSDADRSPRRDLGKRPMKDRREERYSKKSRREDRYARPQARKDDIYERGYNSDEWSDQSNDQDDSDDESDTYGIEALDREEEISRKWGQLEDRQERQREKQYNKEKQRRREEFERQLH